MLKIHDKDVVIYDGMTLPTLHQRLQAARAEIGLNTTTDTSHGVEQWVHMPCGGDRVMNPYDDEPGV